MLLACMFAWSVRVHCGGSGKLARCDLREMVKPLQESGKEPILRLSSERLHTVSRKCATARDGEVGPSPGSEARGSSTPKDSAPDSAASSAGASNSTAANGEAVNFTAAPDSSGALVYEQVLTSSARFVMFLGYQLCSGDLEIQQRGHSAPSASPRLTRTLQ